MRVRCGHEKTPEKQEKVDFAGLDAGNPEAGRSGQAGYEEAH